MAGPRPYSLGFDELQRRLCKLYEEKDLIVTLLDDMLVNVDAMVAHGRNLTNMSQFFSYFVDASSMMELVYMKLFKVHLFLTEDTYVDSEQQSVPRMAITYTSPDNSDRYSNSQLAALEAPKDSLSCLPSGSQEPSSPYPSIYDEVLGHQTSAASFLLSQETVAAIPSFTAAYARLATVVGTTQGIVISFYKTPSEFWIQLDSSANILEDILKSLQEYYSSSTQRREITVKAGMYCAAYYADDGRWRRARILQVLKGHVKVFYVDFGNSDRVSMDYLCFLEEEFTTYPAQALWCTIKNMESAAGSGIWRFPAIRAFRDKISAQGKKLQAFFHSQDIATGQYTVDILGVNADNVSVNLSQEFITTCSSGYPQPNNLEALNFATKLPVTHLEVTATKASTSGVMPTTAVTSSITVPPAGNTPPTTTSAHTISQPSMHSGPVLSMCVPPPGMRPVGMPHASTPSNSALPCKAPLASVVPVCTPQLGASLAGPPSAPTGKAPPPVGTAPPPAGSAPSPAGMAPPPEGMVPPPTSMAAPPDGVTTPATAMVPRPAGISPPPSNLSPAATGMTSSPAGIASPSAESAVASTATAAIAPTSAPRGSMQPPGLYPAAWHPIYPQLACTRPPAVVPPAILPEGNTFNVCLSVVFNPSDFYCQIVENVNPTFEVLEELHQNLNKCGSQSEAPEEEMVTKDSFWISRYHGDQKWYRARILDVLPGPTSKCFRVLYVDYGNRCTVDSASLRPLPPELASLPACALRMSLANVCPNKGNKWDEAAIALLSI
ncbi:hypothetical protein MRX96_008974 [Rhipicephalus microplus]